MTPRPARPKPVTYQPQAHLTDDVEAVRNSLRLYALAAAELPELMRAAARHDVPISEIARLAGVDRGRVHRAIRNRPDIDPEATRETAEELRHNVMTGAYSNAPARRLLACIERWPECHTGGYDPRCCRFPTSCSADIYSAGTDESLLEAGPDDG